MVAAAVVAPVGPGLVAHAATADAGASFTLAAGNGDPKGIWSDGTTMWVTQSHYRYDKIFAYELATGDQQAGKDINSLSAVRFPTRNGSPEGLWSDGTTLWVAEWIDEKIFAYDLATGERRSSRDINTLKGAGNNSPRGIWSDGATMWVVDNWHDKVFAYDLATGARRADKDINRLGGSDPRGIWSNGNVVWISDARSDWVFAYDLATGARQRDKDIGTLRSVGNRDPMGIWSDGGTMWVADNVDDKVYAYSMPANSSLTSLELTGMDIGAFAASRWHYEVHVPNTTTVATVVAAKASSSSEVTITPADADADADGHQIALGLGDTTVTVAVTNGSYTSTYSVVVTQVDTDTLTDVATLSALSFAGVGDLGFDSETTSYIAGVANSKESTTVTAATTDSHATMDISPADADADADGHQVNLPEGRNTVRLTVESSDGLNKVTYTAHINRDSTADFGWTPTRDLSVSGSAPRGAWSDGTTMWMTSYDINTYHYAIRAHDAATGERQSDKDIDTDVLRSAGNGHPTDLWSDRDTMWVADLFDRRIYAYDMATGERQTGKDIVLHGRGGSFLGIWSDGTTMWVVNHWEYVYAYDLATGRSKSTGPEFRLAPENNDASGMWSDGDTMWITDPRDAKVYAYDLGTGDRLPDKDFDTLRGAGNHEPKGMWSDGDTMWITDLSDDHIYAYNLPQFNASLSSLSLNGVEVSGFDPETLSYQVDAGAVSSVTVAASAGERSASVTILPEDSDDQAEGHQVALTPGASTSVTVTVASRDGTVSATYTMTLSAQADPSQQSGSEPETSQQSGSEPQTTQPSGSEPETSQQSGAVPQVNSPATGAPVVSGVAQVGETLTADTSGIADADGLTDVAFSYQWIRSNGDVDADIPGATGSAYTLVDADRGSAVKVLVSFDDSADNEESLTSAASATVAGPPLTVLSENVPAAHDGRKRFSFVLRFSEEFTLSYKTLRDAAFSVTGGTVKRAKRLDKPSNQHWRIVIKPDSSGDVTVVLPIPDSCDSSGAICADDGRKLSNGLEFIVSGPSQ